MNPSPAARGAEAELSRVEVRDTHGAKGVGLAAGDRATAVKVFRGLASTALKVLGPTDLLLLARPMAISVADRLGISPSQTGNLTAVAHGPDTALVERYGCNAPAAAPPSEINGAPQDTDSWAGAAWDFVRRAAEAWKASGKPAPFSVSVDQVLRALGAPAGKAKTRRDANRVCRILRGKGLVYRRQRVFADDGNPVYVGDTAEQLREYRFLFAQVIDNTEADLAQ